MECKSPTPKRLKELIDQLEKNHTARQTRTSHHMAGSNEMITLSLFDYVSPTPAQLAAMAVVNAKIENTIYVFESIALKCGGTANIDWHTTWAVALKDVGATLNDILPDNYILQICDDLLTEAQMLVTRMLTHCPEDMVVDIAVEGHLETLRQWACRSIALSDRIPMSPIQHAQVALEKLDDLVGDLATDVSNVMTDVETLEIRVDELADY